MISRQSEESDYNVLREMMIREFRNDPLNRNWTYERLDWIRHHYFYRKNMAEFSWTDFCHVWESDSGQFIAAVLFETPGFFSLQILPDWMDKIDYSMLIGKAEEMHRSLFPEKKRLEFEIDERDTELISIFSSLGYKIDEKDYMIVFDDFDLRGDIPSSSLPDGYRIRHISQPGDYIKKNETHSLAFKVGDNYPEDNFSYLPRAQGYIEELDLVVEYKDRFVANCGGWYDEYNRRGSIEPLGVHPDFQGKGLGKAIVHEMFKRLKDKGAHCLDMHSSEDNRAFYTSVGYRAISKRHIYYKEI